MASRRSSQPARRKKKRGLLWARRAFALTLLVSLMGGCGLVTGVGLMVAQIPPVEKLLEARPLGTTTIYDREGRLITSLQNGENRHIVRLDEISDAMKNAVVASEDARFYQHFGIDPLGLARAVFTLGHAGGGSTLTQQLSKLLFLSSDRTLTRKLADMWLAIQLERTLSKDQILALYLNQVYFGHGAYGVESAARLYFNKRASRLTVGEAAMLTGLLPAPEYYSPFRNLQAAKDVQRLVLRRMVTAGKIDQAAADAAVARPLELSRAGMAAAYRAPYFVSQVLGELSERFGRDLVMRGGFKITTTMDYPMQEAAEAIVRAGVARYRGSHVGQGALVAIEPGSGEVRALVGGTDYGTSQFNRATQAHRQPGSTFKPFVYVTAFDRGYGPGSTIADEPVSYGRYSPVNYDRRYHGVVSLESALAHSLNVPAVKLAHSVGIDNVVRTAHAAGIQSELPYNLSVALGSAEVTPLELASAYATFAAEGVYAKPHLISRVLDKDDRVIERNDPETRQAIPVEAVQRLTQALQAVILRGSGGAANFGRPAAGKTGTTSENRDTWFAGYTPQLACVVWLGNDDNSRLGATATGGVLAAPLWRQFMDLAHRGLPVRGFAAAPPAAAGGDVDEQDGTIPAGAGSAAPEAGAAASAPASAASAAPSADPGAPGTDALPPVEPVPSEALPAEPSMAPYAPAASGPQP